jgi:hypothetical protein
MTGIVPNARPELEQATSRVHEPAEVALQSTPQRSSDESAAPPTISMSPPEATAAAPTSGAAAIVALLVVDPRRAPPSLYGAPYPEGELLRRLADAQRAAAGRAIVALLSVTYPDRRIDAVLVERATARAKEQEAEEALERLLAADADRFELIELPARR